MKSAVSAKSHIWFVVDIVSCLSSENFASPEMFSHPPCTPFHRQNSPPFLYCSLSFLFLSLTMFLAKFMTSVKLVSQCITLDISICIVILCFQSNFFFTLIACKINLYQFSNAKILSMYVVGLVYIFIQTKV